MNAKKKLLVVVLVLMMMFTAVAYAAWSDTIEVNGTVSTGEFDVQWSSTSTGTKSAGATEGTINVERITNDVDTLEINIENAKPGDIYTITAISENVGTLSAVYKGMSFSNNGTPGSWINASEQNSNASETFEIGDDEAYTVSTTSNGLKTLIPQNGDTTDKQTFTFTVTILDTANQDTSNNTGSFYIHFNYEQQ